MYMEGNGVPQNYILACMWFILATDNNYSASKQNLDDIKSKISSAEIENAEKLAEKWRAKFIK